MSRRTRTDSAANDRHELVHACMEVADQVTSAALRDRLVAALRCAGVVPDTPLGERFDPRRHEAVGRVATRDAELHNTIAEVEAPGWVDRGSRLRLPRVLVHRFGEDSGGMQR